MLTKSKILTAIFPFLIFIFTFIIYLVNLSPSVYGGDSGDFLAAVASRGIPHPSGYPLYTILGIIFTSLPIPLSFAWKYGLVSAFFSALTVIVFYHTIHEISKNRYLAITTSLTLAFTYPFWLYAEIVEVFALHNFFILILIFFTIRFVKTLNNKYIYWLSFFTGLSLTNNLSIIILFPPIIIALLITKKKLLLDFKTIFKSLILFSIGLTPYLYIPLASYKHPFMDWGHVVNFENFTYLVLRKYYGWGLSGSKEKFTYSVITYRFTNFINYWKSYIHILIPFLIVPGFIQILRKRMFKIFIFLSISLFLLGPFFIIYSGTYHKSFLSFGTLEKFYIPIILISYLLIPPGIEFFLEIISKLKIRKFFIQTFRYIIYFIAFLIAVTSLIVNYSKTNFRNVYIGDNLGIDTLTNLPENSILLLRNDSLSFNALYYQQAYNYRGDVLIPGPHNGFDANLRLVFETEEDIKKYKETNKGGIDKDTLNASIAPLMEKGSVYIDGFYSLTDNKYGEIVTIPYGLLYKFEFYKNLPYPKEKYINELKQITDLYNLEELEDHKQILSNSLILADIKKLYSTGFENIANFLHEQYQEDELAKEYLIKSIELDPVTRSN
jgi:hypothetical protein